MKRIFCFLVFTVLIGMSLKSQNVCSLGSYIIEKNNFALSKKALMEDGFTLFSSEELSALGHNPQTKIIGTTGMRKNAVIATVTMKNNSISEVVFICGVEHNSYLHRALKERGYVAVKNRRYLEDGRFEVTEFTYERKFGRYLAKVIVQLFDDGSKITFFGEQEIKKN